MDTKKLTKEEFINTMGSKMVDVTRTATPQVDIWPYVQQLTREKLVLEYVNESQLVEAVYRNHSNTYDHVLLPTGKENAFVAIVVNLTTTTIDGHYFLDLAAQYR